MGWFKKGLSVLLGVIIAFQTTITAFAQTSDGKIKDSSFSLENQKSSFDEYSDKDWEETFPLGTFVVEYPQYTVKEGGTGKAGESSDTYLGINIARFGGKNTRVVLEYMTSHVTTTDDDYELTDNKIIFEPGEEMKTVNIKINDNKIAQTDRYFAFTLVDAGDAHIGDFNRALIKIVDDEPYIPTKLTATAPKVVDKGDGKAVITLRRTQGVEYFFTVDISTEDLTAKENEDYIEVKQTVTFQPKEVEHTVEIPLVHNDIKDEIGKDFKVILSNPKGGEIVSGNSEITIKLTNKIPDPTYVIVNSEQLASELDSNDKSKKTVNNGLSLTDSIINLDANTPLSTKKKVATFFSAMSGRSVTQSSSYTKWEPTYPVISSQAEAPSVYKNTDGDIKLDSWLKNALYTGADANGSVFTDNNINFNDLYQISINWCNDPGGGWTNPATQLDFTGNGDINIYEDPVVAWGNGAETAKWGYYLLNPSATSSGSDNWSYYAGASAKNRGLKFHVNGRGGLVPKNHLYIANMNYYRAIIPFERLVSPGTNWYEITNGIEFSKDGFTYSIVLADVGAGGIGTIEGSAKKGFYINSHLKVIVKPTTEQNASKVPISLYIKDSANNIHNQSLPAGGVGTAFIRTDIGYQTTIKLNTMAAASVGATSYDRIMSGKYTNIAKNSTETDKYFNFTIDTSDVKTVNVVYDNTKELFEQSGFSADEIINSIVTFSGLKTIFEGTYSPENYKLGFGQVNYSSLILNTKPALLGGKSVNIKIIGTPFNKSEGIHTLPWADSNTSAADITIVLSDPNQKVFDPAPTVSKVGSIIIDNDESANFEYHRDMYLSSGFSKLRFENVHSADSNGYANGGLIFNIDFTDRNLYPPKITDTPAYYKVVVKKADSTGKSEEELLTFVHEADNIRTGNVLYSKKGVKVSKYDIKRTAKNSYQIALQSKFNYAQSSQAGQLFIGGENIVIEVYDMDTLENISNSKSATKRIKTLSKDDTVSILPQVPNDQLKTDALSYTTEVQPGQKDFYVYKDDTSSMDLPPFDFDLGTISEAFNTSKVGFGGGVAIDGDELTISFSLSGEPIGGDDDEDSGIKKLKDTMEKTNKQAQEKKKSAAGQASKSKMTQKSNALKPVGSSKKSSGSSKSKAEGSFELSGGFALTLKFDTVTGSWQFDNMYFMFSIAGGIEQNTPVPVCPIFYFHLSASAELSLATGFRQVPVGYWGGKLNRKVVFAGFNMSPSLYLGIGVGAGVSGVLGIEASFYVQAGLSATFGATVVTMGNNIMDFNTNDEDNFKLKGNWSQETDQNSYKNSVMTTAEKGASVTYEVDAYQIYIKGNLLEDGGIMNISVARQDGTIVDAKTIDTKFTSNVSNVTFYNKNLGARDKYKITISLDQGSADNTKIALDEVDYRTLESNYKTETLPASLDSWRFQFGLKLDIYVLFFSFSIDLIYFYVDQDGIGWGYPFTEKKINKTLRSLSAQEDELLDELPRGYNYVELGAKTKVRSLSAYENYYDLGDYADNKTLNNLALNLMPTTQAKIYRIGENTITLWIIDDLSRTDGDQRQALVYSINGAPAKILDDDGTGDTEFAVGENSKGELVVVWTSSTGISNGENADSIEKYKMLNNSMEIKTASIDLSMGRVSPIVKLSNTADSRQDLLPAYAARGEKNIIAFVKDEKTKYDANVKPGYTPPQQDEEQAKLAEDFNTLQNAVQTGVHKNYYAMDTGSGYSDAVEIPLNISESVWRAGTKVTSNSIEFIDDNTVIYAFTVEVPNAQKGSFTGIERALFVQKGTIGSSGTVDFSDGAICIDKVFDYDASLSEVFSDGNVPAEYKEKITGTETGEQADENPMISDVQFERIGLPDEDEGVTDKLTLFYKNKSKLFSINEDNLKIAVDKTSIQPITITTVMDLQTSEYDLNVTQDGGMYILYSGGVELNEYDTALFIKLYDDETGTWSKEKQLTYNNSFNQSALESGVGGVYSVNFKKLSSVVSRDGSIDILAMSTSSQFKYEMYTPKGETQAVRLAYLDSTTAKRNLDRITFTISDEYVFEGIMPESNTELHIPSKLSVFYVYAENKGDKAMYGGSVELLFRLADGTDELIETKAFSNAWVSEKGEAFEFKYVFPANTGNKYNKARVYYLIKDDAGKIVYNSYDAGKTLEINQELPEVIISADKAEVIRKEDGDYISYKALIKNIGFADVKEQATLKLQLMEYDEENVLKPVRDLLSQVIEPDILKTGVINNQPINVSAQVKLPADITTSFRVTATVTGIESELNKENNDGSLNILYPSTDIILGYEDKGNTFDALVGEEIVFDDFQVVSSMYKASDIVFEEGSTNCLSIDNITNPEEPKIKVMRTSESGYTAVDLTARVKDTTISKTVTINISKRKIFNFGDEGITMVGFNKLESVDNYKNDIVQSTNKDDYIEFDFKGNLIELYGNKNTAGGNITIDIYHTASGSKVAIKTVSTKSDTEEYGVSLAVIDGLDATKNYHVRITNSSGATIKLDKAEVDGAVLDLPASEAYTVINNKSDQLDLPMQNGRQRNGFVSFEFDKNIKLIEGAADNISNFYLTFEVKGIKNGQETVLPEKSFIFDKVEDKTITFKCDGLASDPNYDEVVYTLKDTELMSGFIEAADGSALKRNIPNDKKTAFKLTESKIEKVEIVDCSLPDKLDKAIAVTFEKPQMEDRLTGTKIIYTLSDGSISNDVEFTFEKMNNERQALYVISLKEMDDQVNKLSYTFKNGIVLRDNYTLVSQDGNYVDNIITAADELSFEYERAKAISAVISRDTSKGERIAVYLTFDKPLDVGNILPEDVSLPITQNINNVEKEILLYYGSIDEKRTTIKLVSADLLSYNSGDNVVYSLVKNADIATTKLISTAQRLVVNNNLALPEDVHYQFSSVEYITDTVLMLKDSKFKYQGNIPVCQVLFSTEIDAETMANTFIKAQIADTDKDGKATKDIILPLKTIEKRFDDNSKAYSAAIYEYDDSNSIDFSDTQLEKSIVITSNQIEGAAGNITNLNGGVIISKDLTFSTNKREVAHTILKAPIITATSKSNEYTGNWAASVDVSLEAADAVSYEYKADSGNWTRMPSNKLSICDDINGVYGFRAVDSIGFKGQISSIPVKVDAKLPEFIVTANTGDDGTYENGTLTEQDVVVTIEPAGSNISSVDYFYTVDDGANWVKIEDKKFTISETTNKNYKFKAVSESMLEGYSRDSIKVNISKPKFTAIQVNTNGYSSSYTSGDVRINLSGGLQDMSMLEKYQYSVDGATWKDAQAGESGLRDVVLIDYTTADEFYFRAVSKSGSTGADTAGTQIRIDKEVPTIKVTGNSETPVQQAALDIDRTFGISGATVTVNDKPLSGTNYVIDANGTYTFVITNGAGVSAKQVVTVTNIDKQKPVISIDSNGYVNDIWSNKDVTLSICNSTDNLGTTEFEYSLNEGPWTMFDRTITVSTDTIANYKFRAASQSGVSSDDASIVIKVDKTAPVISSVTFKNTNKNSGIFAKVMNVLTFGKFFNQTVEVEITASDNLSKVAAIEYQFIDKNEDIDENKWQIYDNDNKPSKNANWTGYAAVKVSDNAGNYAVTNTDGIVVDGTEPELELKPDKSGWSTGNITVKVTASDNLAGLNEVSYITDESVPQTGTAEIFNGTGTITLTNEGQYTLTVKARDNSQNEITKTAAVKIDKSLPVINGVTGNKEDWTGDNITLTVNASDGVSDLAAEAYSFDGGDTWQAANTKIYDANTEGIAIKVKDNAGNIAAYDTVNITKIDKTLPNAPVVEDAEKYTEAKWYNTPQAIKMSFARSIGCDEKLQYKLDNGAWIDGEGVSLTDEGRHTVSFRVMDIIGRTSTEQTIKVNIDKTAPTNIAIAVKDNKFTTFLNTITFGLFFKDTVDVSITADGDISGINHYEYQVVDTSKGQSYDENGTWKRGDSFSILPQYEGAVYARAVDNAQNTSNIVSSAGVMVDSISPTIPAIEATVDNVNYTGAWTTKDILIKASGSTALSGIDHYEYKIGTDGQWKTMTQESGAVDSVTGNALKDQIIVNQGIDATYYIRAVSNSAIVGTENSIIVKRDSEVPNTSVSYTGVVNGWTNEPVTFTVVNANEQSLAPVSFYIKIGSADWVKLDGNSYTFNDEMDQEVQFKTATAAKTENINQSIYHVQIDKTNLVISGAENSQSYYIGRRINVNDSWGEIGSSVYSKDGKKEVQFADGDLISSPGKYNIMLMDKAGNKAALSFTIKALPGVSDIKYTRDSKALVEKIRDEFNGHNDLTEPYKSRTDKAIRALENRYAILDKEVKDEVAAANSIPTVEDGLIAQKGKIQEVLCDINELTKEQQAVLKSQINELDLLLARIDELEAQVNDFKADIQSLPATDKLSRQDLEKISSAKNTYDGLNDEQKTILGNAIIAKLDEAIDRLSSLMLYDEPSNITVSGVDGIKFSLGTHLVVIPITTESNESSIGNAKIAIVEASKTNDELKKKDLLALYDLSLFESNTKIQPDGKVQVKIEIPGKYANREGLEIIHISDDGTVTVMHAENDGKYLTFITDHFSQYGIIGNNTCLFGICKALGIYEKNGGVCCDWAFILGVVFFIFNAAAVVFYRKRRKKQSKESAL